MNQQRQRLWIVIGLLLILAFVLLLHPWRKGITTAATTNSLPRTKEWPSPSAGEHDQGAPPRQPAATGEQHPVSPLREIRDRTEQTRREGDREISMWQSPILYFGKVLDESNQPISGVLASYRTSALNEARSEVENSGTATSDARGIFRIDGVNGVGLMLELSHPNYYPYPENSTGFDKRSLPQKGYFSDSEENAEVFRMHSKGTPVPLVSRGGGFHASNDGSVANFPLRGKTRAEILGQLEIQGWSRPRSEANPYDWKARVNLPNGGISESTNYFDFVAPEAGYSNSASIEVSGGEMAQKIYFLKLAGGYIRFKLKVIMGKDMFVSGDYYYNPDGSRNLEDDSSHPFQEP